MSPTRTMADPLIVDAAERLFANAADEPFDRALWQAFQASGLASVLADAGLADAAAVCHAAGRHAAAIPLVEAMVAQAVAASRGMPAPSGVVALGLGSSAEAVALGDGRWSGTCTAVPFGRHARQVLIGAGANRARQLVWVEVEPGHWQHADNLAGEASDTLQLRGVAASAIDAPGADSALELAALLRAAQMTGAMESALELALEHAKTRVQFGKPIAQFQAVQQMLACLAAECAAAAAAVDLAVQGADGGWPSTYGAAVAKARCGEAAGHVAELAHQVIAAMAYTRDFPLHRRTRRLWTWRDDYGSEACWQQRLGQLAVARDSVWNWVSGQS